MRCAAVLLAALAALLALAGPAAATVVPTPAGLSCPATLGDLDLFRQQTEDDGFAVTTFCSYYPRAGFQQESYATASWIRDPSDAAFSSCDQPGDPTIFQSETHAAYSRFSVGFAGDEALLRALAQSLLAAAEPLAAPCPAAAPPPTTTAAPPATTAPPPAAACDVEGRVTDFQGKPVAGVHVQVRSGGGRTVDVATGDDGGYRVDGVAGDVTVRLLLEEGPAPALGRFRIYHAGSPAALEAKPFRVEQGADCRRDLVLDGSSAAGTVLANPAGAEAGRWRDLGSIYQRARKALEYARSLGVTLDYGLPLPVYAWCTDPGLECASGSSPAFYVSSTAAGQAVAQPYVALKPRASALADGRYDDTLYHELGHAVMADAFGNVLPGAPGDLNHGGYYLNAWSTDSWVEGFADFFAAMVAKHVDRRFLPEQFQANGFVKDLEWDWSAWNGVGREEEWAVAGLLLDLEDGPADYRAGRATPDLYRGLRWGKASLKGRPAIVGTIAEVHAEDVTVAVELFDAAGRKVLAKRAFYRNGWFALPLPPGLAWASARIKVLEGRYGEGRDDDPLDLDPQVVWQAIAGYGASKQTKGPGGGYPHIASMFQLFRALDRALGGRDVDGDGQKDVVQVFRSHGFFADRNGNLTPDGGEATGLTSHPAYAEGGTDYPERDPRYTAEPLPAERVLVDTGGVGAATVVFVDYPGEAAVRSYSYLATPGDDGRIPVAVPPAASGATVTLLTLAPGYVPAVAGEIDAASFWARAGERLDQPFLSFPVELERGELSFPAGSAGGRGVVPFALLAGGGLLLAAAGALLLPRRRRVAP